MQELLEQLIKIPSVSADKEACRACLEHALKQFENTSVHIERQENNGVVSALVSTHETYDLDVLWLIHLDVVPAPQEAFSPVLKENRLYGRGSLDMKSSAAVAICLLKDLLGKVPFKMGILFATDEEVGGKNGASFWQEKKNLTAKIVLDPDSSQPIETIIYKTKKPLFVKLTATGKAAHGSRPWLGKDANEALLQTLTALRQKFPAYDMDSPNVPDEGWVNTLHVGTIHGGTASNIIADNATAELDFRLIETTSIEQALQEIESVKPANVSVEILSCGNAVVLDKNNPIVSFYHQTVQDVIGHPVEFKTAFGATDGRYFAEKSIVLTHQATGANAHQNDEWIDLNSLRQFYEIQKKFFPYK